MVDSFLFPFGLEIRILFGDAAILAFVELFDWMVQKRRFLLLHSGYHCYSHAGLLEPHDLVD